jgi:ubiquinone/menaquinone biosynthesis C-methylase UbiE
MVDAYEALLPDPTEIARYRTMYGVLAAYASYFTGRSVLDYGCSWGTSAVALHRLGARTVFGVDPDQARVEQGRGFLTRAQIPPDAIQLEHLADTRVLPVADRAYDFVLANGVLEHIPWNVRQAHIRELWRVVASGGVLVVNETPNSYYPKERHTTRLWFNQWLPERLAYRRAVRAGRYSHDIDEWRGSGWRGLGWYELVEGIRDWRLLPERSRVRHRLLTALGLPASLFDPAPTWVLQKVTPGPNRGAQA